MGIPCLKTGRFLFFFFVVATNRYINYARCPEGAYPGADPGEVKWVNFHPPFSEPPSFFLFSYPSNIEIIFDFSD